MDPAADVASATILMWITVAVVVLLGGALVPLMATVHRHYARWLVFRARGRFYTQCLTWMPPAQYALSLAAVILCVQRELDRTSPALLALVVAEQICLFALCGVIIARQVVLSQIFQTLPWQHRDLLRALAVRSTPIFLGVMGGVCLVWITLATVPQALMAFGIVGAPVASVSTLLAAALVASLYALVVVCNRHIQLTAFCDYGTNIATFCMMVVLTVATACVNTVYYYPNGLWQSNVALRSLLYVLTAAMYALINYIRPVWAVWRGDAAYLNKFESSLAAPSATSMKDLTSSASPLARMAESVRA